MARNVQLYPWYQFLQNLMFWQATWFLYFQQELSAAEALLLYVAYDVSVTALEVPSGYMSDRIGRRATLIAGAVAYFVGLVLLGIGGGFAVFLAGQILLGTARAFNSGTDTALLYQSLAADGRADAMEDQSLRAWRFGFLALAASAVTGGVVALYAPSFPFYLSALALAVSVWIACLFAEPPRGTDAIAEGSELLRFRDLMSRFKNPVLTWLFCLGMLMYGFSHIPFVFGQPFIEQTLSMIGYDSEAPLVSGAITTTMMVLGVLVSLIAPKLRKAVGLGALLCIAFAMQVGLAAVLAASGSVVAISMLLLRMVPDSLSTPFILARLQPLLGDETRATFLSLKSFLGRLLFAGSLLVAASSTTDIGAMPLPDIQSVLWWYVAAGTAALIAFAFSASRIQIEKRQS